MVGGCSWCDADAVETVYHAWYGGMRGFCKDCLRDFLDPPEDREVTQ